MDIQLKRGLLEICVLSCLKREDSYGYKLVRDISECVPISESTLYPILKRLSGAGCVREYSVEHNSRLRKYYSITPEGAERIEDFLREWEDIMAVYDFIRGGRG